MQKTILFGIGTALLFLCSCTNQNTYDVRVVNSTQSEIKVDYKSETHRDGPVQNSVIISPGTDKVIISTKELDGALPNLCDSVALYVRASDIPIGRNSKLEWCSDEVKLEQIDIEQYQYLMEFKPEHFTR